VVEPIASVSRQLIAELQERAARAIPAVVEQYIGGDWMRHNDSSATWWPAPPFCTTPHLRCH
jgi:hypothetical protein